MNETKSKRILLIKDILTIIVASLLGAVGIHIFSKSANFAPIGGDGIAKMLSEVTVVSFYYWQLIINIPLIVIGYIFLKKKYIVYTLGYILCSSLFVFILEITNCPSIQTVSKGVSDTGLRLMCACFAGIILGVRTGFMLRIGGSSGGTDIPACLFNIKFKGKDVELVIGVLSITIALCSYFLYRDFISIMLSMVEMIALVFFCGIAQKDARNALEFKIITKHPDEVRKLTINKFRHGVTMIEGKGGFTNNNETIIFTVIGRRELSNYLEEISKIPDTFAYYSNVIGIRGNFRWRREDKAK